MESRIDEDGLQKAAALDLDSSDLRQQLDLKKRDRGDPPRTIMKDPGILGEALRVEENPEKEVGVEEDQKEPSFYERTQGSPGPFHSQRH
jgi:hypothetical protein